LGPKHGALSGEVTDSSFKATVSANSAAAWAL
jgi:hypothetical protein